MKSQSKSQGKSFVISLVSLIFILGLVILSDTAPSLRFETQTLQKAPQNTLSQIKGKADCSCKDAPCVSKGTSTCQWYNRSRPDLPDCDGCKGKTPITAKYGTAPACFEGENRTDPSGCCNSYCRDNGCLDQKCKEGTFEPTGINCGKRYNIVFCKKETCYKRVS